MYIIYKNVKHDSYIIKYLLKYIMIPAVPWEIHYYIVYHCNDSGNMAMTVLQIYLLNGWKDLLSRQWGDFGRIDLLYS